MSTGELACTYAALILHDDKIAVTAEKLAAILKAANITVEAYWPTLFAKMLSTKNIGDLISNVGSAPAGGAAPAAAAASAPAAAAGKKDEKKAAPKVEEKKEEEDDDMGFSLFD